MDKKRGIVLSGGGARGAYQIGVLEELKKAGWLSSIYAYSGSSVGSLNAVLLAMDNLDLAEKTWLTMESDALFETDLSFFKQLFKEGKELFHNGLYKTDKLDESIKKVVDYDAIYNNDIFVTTSHSGSKYAGFWELVSLNISSIFSKEDHVRYTNLRTLSKEDIHKTLLASCAIPVAFQPVVINAETFYDGGIMDNTPYLPLIKHGCKDIIIIDLFRFRLKRNKYPEDVTLRVIKPSKSLGGIMDFSPKQITRRFELGKEDAKAFIQANQTLLENT